MNLWEQIIIEWVNCLHVLENPVKDINELQDGIFYEHVLHKSSWDGHKNIQSEESIILLFIKDEYPEFYIDLQDKHAKLEELHIVSLLLLYTAPEPSFQRPMCLELHPDTQIKIKSFLEMLLPYEKNITKEILDEAIMELEDAAPKDLCVTPKTKPLKEFFESPAARSAHTQRIMTERMRELRQLKSDLETERFEKMDLQEDVRIQQTKIEKLQKKLDEKIAEIKALRAERMKANTPQSCKKSKSSRYSEEYYKREIKQLERELIQSQSEGQKCAEERDNLIKKVSLIEKQYFTIKEKYQHSEKSVESLMTQVELKDRELVELRMNNEELRSHFKELTRVPIEEPSFEGEILRPRSPLPVGNVSEILSSVIDIQLQEAKEESASLRVQLDSLHNRLDALNSDHQLVLKQNATLQEQARRLEDEIKVHQKEFSSLKAINVTLQEEKITVENECKDLKDLLALREKLLSEAEESKNMLSTEIQTLNEIIVIKEAELTSIREKNNILGEEKIRAESECTDLTNSLKLKEKLLLEAEHNKTMLEKEINSLKDTIITKETELTSAREENRTLLEEKMKIKSECEHLLESRSLMEKSLSEVEHNKTMLEKEISNLKDTVATKETELTAAREENGTLIEEKMKIKSECEHLLESLSLMETLLSEVEHNKTMLEKEINNLKDTVTIKETELTIIRQENKTLEEERMKAINECKDLNELLVLKEKLLLEAKQSGTALVTEIQGLKETITIKETELMSSIERNKMLEEEKIRTETCCYDLQNSLVLKEKLLLEVEQDRTVLSEKIQSLSKTLTLKDEQLSSSKEKYEVLEEEKMKLENECKNLKDSLASKEKLLFDLEQNKVGLNTEVQNLKEIVAVKDEELSLVREKCKALEEEKIMTQNECEDLKNSLTSMEKMLVESERFKVMFSTEIENLKQILITKENKLSSVIERREALEKSLILKEELLSEAKDSEMTLNSQIRNLNETILIKETELTSTQKKNKILEEQKVKGESECKELKDLLALKEKLLSEHEHAKISFQTEIQGLNDVITMKDTELTSIIENKKSLEEEKVRTEIECRELRDTLALKEKLLSEAELSKTVFEAEVQKLNDLAMKTEASLLTERNKCSELTNSLSRVNAEYEEYEKNIKASLKEVIMCRSQTINGSINVENFNTDELIKTVVKILSDYEETCNNKEEEMKKLNIQLSDVQKELSSIKESMKTLEEEKLIAKRDSTALRNLIQVKEELLIEKNALLDVLETLVADLRREKDNYCNAEDAKMCKIQKISEQLVSSMKDLKLVITEMCPNLAEIDDKNSDISSDKTDMDNNDKCHNILNAMTTAMNEIRISQKGIVELSEARKNMEKVLLDQSEVIKDVAKTKEENQLLNDKIENLQTEKQDFNKCIGSLLKHREGHSEVLSRIMLTRESVEMALTTLKEKWCTVVNKYKGIFVNDSSMCDELKHLQAKKEELENTLQEYEITHLKNMSPLTKILWQTFLWTEEKLQDAHTRFSTVQENMEVLKPKTDDHFCEERKVIESELEKHKAMQEKIVKSEEDIETFVSLATSYENNFNAGQIKKEPKVEEKLKLQIDQLSREKKDLKQKLDNMRVRNAKLERNMDDLRAEMKRIKTEKSSDESSALEDMKKEIKNLEEQISRLQEEKEELNKRPKEEEVDNRLKEVHSEYELKLENMKQKMKSAYNEQVAKMNKQQERAVQEKVDEMKQLCRKHSEEIKRYKEHVGQLSKQLWSVGENLLIAQKQKEEVIEQMHDLKTKVQNTKHVPDQQKVMTTHSRTRALESGDFSVDSLPRQGLRTVELVHEERMYERRSSMRSIQAMGNAFNAEDEEGEVFDSIYLADMKEGRCIPSTHLDRLSVLQMRNSLCKPHLKSSYPAETQFHPLGFTEEDIKNHSNMLQTGSVTEDVFNDSLTQSLLSEQKPKKKDRTQTSYKKPGPPTPSKNGGRLSLQGNEIRSPNSRILKDRNVERRTTITPRRLKDIFSTSSSKRQDENSTSTPKGRRLSSIFRKPRATTERF